MKKTLLTICLLAGLALCQGCAPISGFSLVAGAADSLSFRAEAELIQTIKEQHTTWHSEQ